MELTGRTPNQILAESRRCGVEVESWQVALEHLDYPLATPTFLQDFENLAKWTQISMFFTF